MKLRDYVDNADYYYDGDDDRSQLIIDNSDGLV